MPFKDIYIRGQIFFLFFFLLPKKQKKTKGENRLPRGIGSSNLNEPAADISRLNDSRAQRIVWLLEELGLEYEVIPFRRDPQTMFAPPELGKVHPLGKAPAVGILYPSPLSEASSGSRDEKETVLVESGFITQYLCEHFSTDENRLVPKRYAPGNEGKAGGETEAWMRYQHLLHYAEGSLMPPLLLALILSSMYPSLSIPFI